MIGCRPAEKYQWQGELQGLRQEELGRMCEKEYSIVWSGACMGNIHGCVVGLYMRQTSNPRLAWKKLMFSKYLAILTLTVVN